MTQTLPRALALVLLAALAADRPASAQAITADGGITLSDAAGGAINVKAVNNSNLQLWAEGATMAFIVDSNDDFPNTSTHRYVWYVNTFDEGSRGMDFTISESGDDGTLRVAGPVVSNAFDLAESFWMSEPLEAGQIVAVDPERGDAVRRSAGAYDRRIVGAASTRPGVVLGGTVMSLAHLERSWGTAAVELFERERPELETLVLGEAPALAERRRQLAGKPAGDDSEDALTQLETEISDRVMRRFLERHVVAVALAGRVPVLVDASAGPIAPGDPITSGPEPGIAMRADRPGPIVGYALEGLAEDRGRILVLVQRGWFAGEGPPRDLLAACEGSTDRLRAELDAQQAEREREIAQLRRRLDDLARHVATEGQVARVSGRPDPPK